MASELIAEAITDYFGERCLDYAAGCPTCEAWAEYDRWNARPAPAATDTGLETLSVELTPSGHPYMKSDPDGDYVTRSQAEELLAAERAEKEKERLRFEGDLDKWMKIIGAGITGYQPEAYALMDLACEELVKLRADNAAQAARIKELDRCHEGTIDLCNQKTAQIEALEAKLAAAEKALEPLADIADLIDAETEGMAETDELVLHFHDYEFAKWPVSLFRKARAVLGGKPS